MATGLCRFMPVVASCPSRLRRTHRRDSIFVDLDDVASRVWAAREALEAFRSPENDRVGVAAGLDHVALFNLLVEERVEAVPASAERIDLTHQREYRKCGCGASRLGTLSRKDI